MKKNLIAYFTLCSTIALTACQGVDDILTDTGMRQHSEQDVVVNPVPRTRIPKGQTYSEDKKDDAESAIPAAPTSSTSEVPAAQTTEKPANANSSNMVPNVAPSFGE